MATAFFSIMENAMASSTSAAAGPSEEEQKKSSQQLQATPTGWQGSFTVRDLKGTEMTLTRSPGGLNVSEKDSFDMNLGGSFECTAVPGKPFGGIGNWISRSYANINDTLNAEQFYNAVMKAGTVVGIQPPALAESLWFHNGKSCFGTLVLNSGEIAFSRVVNGIVITQGNTLTQYKAPCGMRFSKDKNYGGVFKPASDFVLSTKMTAQQFYNAVIKGGTVTDVTSALAEHVGWVNTQAQGAAPAKDNSASS